MKFLSMRFRLMLAVAMFLLAGANFVAAIFDHNNVTGAVSHAYGGRINDWINLVSSLVLMVLGYVIMLAKQPTVHELVDEAHRQIEVDQNMIRSWVGVKTVRRKFSELSLFYKICDVGFIIAGFAFLVYACVDILGLVPVFKLPRPDHTFLEVSRYITAPIEVSMALWCCVLAVIMRFDMVDTIDDETRRIFSRLKTDSSSVH